MCCVGLGRGRKHSRSTTAGPGQSYVALAPPGTWPSPMLGCHIRHDPFSRPHLGAKPGICLSLCPHPQLTPAKLQDSFQGLSPLGRGKRSKTPFTKQSRSTPHDARRKLPIGATATTRQESHHLALCGSLWLVTLLVCLHMANSPLSSFCSYKDTSHNRLEATPFQYDLILTHYIWVTQFLKKVMFRGTSVFWGYTISPIK